MVHQLEDQICGMEINQLWRQRSSQARRTQPPALEEDLPQLTYVRMLAALQDLHLAQDDIRMRCPDPWYVFVRRLVGCLLETVDGYHLDGIPPPLLLVERLDNRRERALPDHVEQVVVLIETATRIGGIVDLAVNKA